MLKESIKNAAARIPVHSQRTALPLGTSASFVPQIFMWSPEQWGRGSSSTDTKQKQFGSCLHAFPHMTFQFHQAWRPFLSNSSSGWWINHISAQSQNRRIITPLGIQSAAICGLQQIRCFGFAHRNTKLWRLQSSHQWSGSQYCTACAMATRIWTSSKKRSIPKWREWPIIFAWMGLKPRVARFCVSEDVSLHDPSSDSGHSDGDGHASRARGYRGELGIGQTGTPPQQSTLRPNLSARVSDLPHASTVNNGIRKILDVRQQVHVVDECVAL